MTETLDTKAYELRALQASDIFTMSKIISAIGIDEFKSCFQSEEMMNMITASEKAEDTVAETVGLTIILDIANIILKNLSKAEADIYAFLSQLSGKNREELEQLPMNTFVEMICDVIRKDEFKGFMEVVSGFFK